jgi:hypothetical protein
VKNAEPLKASFLHQNHQLISGSLDLVRNVRIEIEEAFAQPIRGPFNASVPNAWQYGDAKGDNSKCHWLMDKQKIFISNGFCRLLRWMSAKTHPETS